MLTAIIYSLFALDQSVADLATQYGHWLFALLFLIIFAETGLVVFPFLPGDSLLFVAGSVAAIADLNVHLMFVTLCVAAIAGDTLNYSIGHWIGPRVYDRPDSRFFRQAHLRRTQEFYDKYGGVTIIIGRFIPIIRTFAPFLAGVCGMSYAKFLSFNVIGAIAWIGSLVYGGYLFGNIPWVKQNFAFIVLGVVVVTLAPTAITFVRERFAAKRRASDAAREAGR